MGLQELSNCHARLKKCSILETTSIDEDIGASIRAAEAKIATIIADETLTVTVRDAAITEHVDELRRTLETLIGKLENDCCAEAIQSIVEEGERHAP